VQVDEPSEEAPPASHPAEEEAGATGEEGAPGSGARPGPPRRLPPDAARWRAFGPEDRGEIVLPCADTSPAAARQWLRHELAGAPPELIGRAVLLASELTTNAVLHARTELRLAYRALPGGLRVEVGDSSPAMPIAKRYGLEAATGRGLTLLGSLAQRWGIDIVPDGKVVWFELDDRRPVGRSAVPGRGLARDRTEGPGARGHGEDLLAYRLLGLPIGLYLRTTAHYEGLHRELRLLSGSGESPMSAAPRRLLEAIERLGTPFFLFAADQAAMLREAASRGSTSLDLVHRLPRRLGESFELLDAVLDEADAYCASADLLRTEPPSADVVAFRKWLASELVRQSRGEPPVAWPESPFAARLADGP